LAEQGFTAQYHSVGRYVQKLTRTSALPFRRMSDNPPMPDLSGRDRHGPSSLRHVTGLEIDRMRDRRFIPGDFARTVHGLSLLWACFQFSSSRILVSGRAETTPQI
jgi:hypothetical protein